jgi:RNA polymerase sigma factor (sigma-70 family)
MVSARISNRMSSSAELPSTPAGGFRPTHWSVVLNAKDLGTPNGQQALEQLCQEYWPPVYVFIRRKGNKPHEAQDLAQGFFERLIEKEFLQHVDPKKGRFRTFLLTAVQRFLCNQFEHSQAQKRGGGTTTISWDHEVAENLYLKEPADESNPEKVYDRRWALTLLEAAMKDLEEEYARAGKEKVFRVLQSFIVGEAERGDYTQAAASLGLTEGNARQLVSRMRQRYGERLRSRIAETVDSDAAVEEELRSLYAALSG